MGYRRGEPERSVGIELITELGCESVQFGIAGPAIPLRAYIGFSQIPVGYAKFNGKPQNRQKANIAEERPGDCWISSARGKRFYQLTLGYLIGAHVLDRGTSDGLR